MRRRLILAASLSAVVVLAVAAPAGAKEFGTIYVDDVAYRTFAAPARVDPGTGTDSIISFTNFDQGGVALHAPGKGSHGGRWAVTMATWTEGTPRLVTDYQEIIELEEAGELMLERAPEADFRCPILPNG